MPFLLRRFAGTFFPFTLLIARRSTCRIGLFVAGWAGRSFVGSVLAAIGIGCLFPFLRRLLRFARGIRIFGFLPGAGLAGLALTWGFRTGLIVWLLTAGLRGTGRLVAPGLSA